MVGHPEAESPLVPLAPPGEARAGRQDRAVARLEEAVAAPRAGPAAGRRVAAQAPSASASGFAEASAAQVHHLTDSF